MVCYEELRQYIHQQQSRWHATTQIPGGSAQEQQNVIEKSSLIPYLSSRQKVVFLNIMRENSDIMTQGYRRLVL